MKNSRQHSFAAEKCQDLFQFGSPLEHQTSENTEFSEVFLFLQLILNYTVC